MMDRRQILAGAAMAAGAAGAACAATWPRPASARAGFAPQPGGWRTFEITTRTELPGGDAQVWVPLPSATETDWFRSLPSTWTTIGAGATVRRDSRYDAEFLHVTFPAGTKPVLEVTSRVQTRDRHVDLTRPAGAPGLPDAERHLYLGATDLIPTDGIVKETADRIVAGAAGEVERARRIYEWVVVNTFRDAAARGCGTGDVATMLRSGHLGGKCADLNALFVGLARAAGLPARDVYGVRIAPSRFGYRSLGANTETVTTAQHCRAEVFLSGFGWVPADPADVRKVSLEERPGGSSLADEAVTAARRALFGAWEGNWLAYNVAHDVILPGAAGPKLAFLMYPQAEVGGVRLDCLDPGSFAYGLRAKEITV